MYDYRFVQTSCLTAVKKTTLNTDERSTVNAHSIEITAKFAVSIEEKQDRLPTLYWFPKLHKRSYEARFIATSSSCTTIVLSKLHALLLLKKQH